MCWKTTCGNCGKATWGGCGAHKEGALRGVPEDQRCPGWRTGRCSAAAKPAVSKPASTTTTQTAYSRSVTAAKPLNSQQSSTSRAAYHMFHSSGR